MNTYLRLVVLSAFALAIVGGLLQLAKVSDNRVVRFAYQPKFTQVRAAEKLFSFQASDEGNIAVPILMYHHVGDLPPGSDSTRRDLTVSAVDFTTEVQWLADRGYKSVSLEQVYQATQGRLQLPSKPVVFTFDDGYTDALLNAPPILQEKGFTGSFAIITRFVGQPDYASWDQIRSAQAQGMEIVSHTQDHFDGTNSKYNYEFIKQNLQGSQEDLAHQLGIGSHILIYPYGHFSDNYIQAAQEAGFDMGLTTAFGNHVDPRDLMRTPRVRIHGEQSMERFEEIITGVKPR